MARVLNFVQKRGIKMLKELIKEILKEVNTTTKEIKNDLVMGFNVSINCDFIYCGCN
jgi:3-oxoacyl-[acyl-carrier-protein] synthase III